MKFLKCEKMEKRQAVLTVSLLLGALIVMVSIGQMISGSTPSGFITIENVDPADIEKYFENGVLKEDYIKEVNENIDQIPDFVLDMFADGKTNVTLQTTDGEELEFNVLVDDQELVGANEGHDPNAEAEVTFDEDIIETIIQADEPVEAFVGAVNSGDIKYEALTPQAKVKGLILSIFSFFVGIIMGIFSVFKSFAG